MKTSHKILIMVACLATTFANAQFLDKLGDRAVKAVERTVERRVEKETTKSTDRVLDTIVDAPKKSKKKKKKNRKNNGGNVIGGNDNSTKGNSSKLVTEGKLSTNAILFNTGSATIKSGSEAILKEVSEAMQSIPSMHIMIVGHTDADGSKDSNLKLSQERAKSVRTVLVNNYGINIGRIQTDGKGDANPVSDNNTSSGKEQNRRVEFIKI